MPVGLVLEGGGQRGAYTAGVLQALYSEGIRFDYIVGVSAGALTAMSYVSGQPRRNYHTFVGYASDPRYMGFSHYFENGGVFNFDFVLGDLVYNILPLDFEAFYANPCRLRIGATDCRTGKAVYFDKEALRGDARLTALRASASLPLVSQIIDFGGRDLLDGGLRDPIPILRSLADGNAYNVVVLTRNADFTPKKPSLMSVSRRMYADYPNLIKTLEDRPERYARQRDLCLELERRGRAVVIRPIAPLKVGRYERDTERLAALYDTAMSELACRLDDIRGLFVRAEKAERRGAADE